MNNIMCDKIMTLVKANTFQAIMITDGSQTFVVYTYKCGDIQWDHLYYTSTIGYNIGGFHYNNYASSGIQKGIAGILGCPKICPNTTFFNILYSFNSTLNGKYIKKSISLLVVFI